MSHLNVSLGSFSLEYAKDINLRAQGLLEATFVSNSMSSSAGPFGVIWKVSKAGGEDSYFAQVGGFLDGATQLYNVPLFNIVCCVRVHSMYCACSVYE